MKIAVLSSHTPSLFRFRADMMTAFRKLGYDVLAVGNEEEEAWTGKFSELGIRYRQARIQRNGLNPLKDLQTFFSLRKILKEEHPDKIFTYQAKTIIYGGIAAASLKITEVYPLIAGVGSVFLYDSFKMKLIRTFLKAEYRFAMRRSPKVFFQNTDDVEIFEKNKIISASKVVLLNGSGVNLEIFKAQELPEPFGFLCISRLIKDKGIVEYLEAAKSLKEKYPSVRCMLVGPYDTNPSALKPEELQPYIDSGVIEYFGEQSDVRPYLAQCNVFVLPSYREGTPKAVLEAMASFKAIITTDAPGCKETVEDGINGYLVPVRDVGRLVACMEKLLNDPEKVRSMASEGRRLAEEKFDVNSVNAAIIGAMGL